MGLDTYRLNRLLNPSGIPVGYPASNDSIVTHTFTYTTNPDGSLKNTYSWGNTYDKNGDGVWSKNSPEDVSAAQYAIGYNQWHDSAPWWEQIFTNPDYGTKMGDGSLDPYVDQAFKDVQSAAGHPWRMTNQCKQEASNLVDKANALRSKK